MFALLCGLALATETVASPDVAAVATDIPAEPAQAEAQPDKAEHATEQQAVEGLSETAAAKEDAKAEETAAAKADAKAEETAAAKEEVKAELTAAAKEDRKFLSAAVEKAGDAEVEVETPAVQKREEAEYRREVTQIADEVQKTLSDKDDATSGSSNKNEAQQKLVATEAKKENQATETQSSSATGEENREVAQIDAEVKQALAKDEAATEKSSEEAAKGSEKAAKGSEEAKREVLHAELAETALVATRASSSMHFATLLACLVSIALIGQLRRRRSEVNQPPLLG
jgi:hypothetical protein